MEFAMSFQLCMRRFLCFLTFCRLHFVRFVGFRKFLLGLKWFHTVLIYLDLLGAFDWILMVCCKDEMGFKRLEKVKRLL